MMGGNPRCVSATVLIETFVQAAAEKKKEKGKYKENHYYEVDTESVSSRGRLGKTQTIIMTATSPC